MRWMISRPRIVNCDTFRVGHRMKLLTYMTLIIYMTMRIYRLALWRSTSLTARSMSTVITAHTETYISMCGIQQKAPKSKFHTFARLRMLHDPDMEKLDMHIMLIMIYRNLLRRTFRAISTAVVFPHQSFILIHGTYSAVVLHVCLPIPQNISRQD